MILAAAYLLWMFQRVVFGELSGFLRSLGGHLQDMNAVEILTLTPLAALTLALGVFPGLVLELLHAPVSGILESVRAAGPVALLPFR
jgi:NADH-quinone oxidoreductase subunit M